MNRLLEMRDIVKRYGAVVANDHINLDVSAGEIVGLLGENGSGKSTLMKVLYGMVVPDGGGIVFRGRELSGHDPKSASAIGIGMIHQHFMLVEHMTVAENIMLGLDEAGWWLRRPDVNRRIRETSGRLGLDIDPGQQVSELSLGARQRVEILKAILRGAELLILDEPTSNLGPAEIASLLDLMKLLRSEGKGVIFISHKLKEVMAVCDKVVVLRGGRVSGSRAVAETSEAELGSMMVDRAVSDVVVKTAARARGPILLAVKDLVLTRGRGLVGKPISFEIRAGEILAITGVDGNGQTELVDTIAGLRSPEAGCVLIAGEDVTRDSVSARTRAGLAYVPADRSTTSLVQSMTIAENLSLRDMKEAPICRSGFLSMSEIERRAERMIEAFKIRTPGPLGRINQLSGGNQQKIVIARELERQPKVLIACQATWGLDPGSTRFVQEQIMALRDTGSAVLYISSELDEVLALGDRIGVLYDYAIAGVMDADAVDVERIGQMIGGRFDRDAATGVAA